MKLYLVIIICVSIFLSGCEKNIEIKSPDAEQILVVEATIENNEYPVVILSKSLNYFGNINPTILSNSFVSNAVITISNGTLTHQLKEYIVAVNANYSVRFYTVNPLNISTAFKGAFNKNYTLNITAEGKSYNAATTIPTITRRIDSLYVRNNDSIWRKLVIKAYDPPGLGDYIRFFTKRNSEPFLPGSTSVFDDAFIDGTSYTIDVDRSNDRNGPRPDGEFSSYFKKGDTASIKICNIDKNTYDFWRTMEYTYQSIGNPFASPIKVLSNIKGAPALGYFGGYASQIKTLIIP
jgi:hypothetical protein